MMMKCRGWLTLAMVACGALGSWAVDRVTFDSQSVMVNGRREFLVSGEFHYFRVPKADWAKRLELLKEAGANCVATYIPWCLHEQEEGKIVFGDCHERDLDGFLKAVEAAGMMAVVRPGPYQYSELMFDGLPRWLIEKYPQIHTKKENGQRLRTGSVDYNHPLFLEKTRNYFKAVAEVIRPHLAKNGGCIQFVQLDNETMGIHLWFGKRGNAAYYEDCADFLIRLRGYLAEFGITGPYCHNIGSVSHCAPFATVARKLGATDFLLGYDRYFNLSQVSGAESPNYDYFLNTLFAADLMRAYGYPAIVWELQAGSIGDVPLISPNDLLASYLATVAAGVKGVNYYVFTGGPNPRDMGTYAEVYDYSAPVSATGEVRPTYAAMKEFGNFLKTHPQLLDARRLTSVRVGFEWQNFANCGKIDSGFNRWGMFYTLMQSAYQPENFLLGGEIPLDRPLVLAGVETMSEGVQRQVAEFVRRGGRLVVAPDFPRKDHEGKPCEILAQALGGDRVTAEQVDTVMEPGFLTPNGKLFGTSAHYRLAKKADMEVLLRSVKDGRAFAGRWTVGKGEVALLGIKWRAHNRGQIDFLETVMKRLLAAPVAKSSQPNVLHSSFALKDGKTGIFVMNLRANPCGTSITFADGSTHDFALKPMEVAYYEHVPRRVPPTEDPRNWIILNMDCNYYENSFSTSMMNVAAIDRHVGERLDPGKVTHFFVNPNGMIACYPSKVVEPCWTKQPWMKDDPMSHKWVRNCKMLWDNGIDRYAEFIKAARKRGVEGWISMRMNDVHGVDQADSQISSFWHNHPEFWVSPNTKSGNWFSRELNYAHREVREHQIAYACEMFDRWDMDGFEADWTRFPQHLTANHEKELAWCLTEVMRAIRAKADEQEKVRGHRIYTAACVLSTPEASIDLLGLDAVTWAKEGLIDVLLVCNFFSCVDFDTQFAEWKRRIQEVNPKVRVVCRIDSFVQQVQGTELTLDAAGFRGYYDNLMAQGCRDFAYFNLFEPPNGSERAKLVMLRGVPREDVYSGLRRYPVTYRDYVGFSRPNASRQLPVALSTNRTVKITVGTVGDAEKVVAEFALAQPLEGEMTLQLNGVSSLAPAVAVPGLLFFDDNHWYKKHQKPFGYRVEFPVTALKQGTNELIFPAVKDNSACGAWLLLTPRPPAK